MTRTKWQETLRTFSNERKPPDELEERLLGLSFNAQLARQMELALEYFEDLLELDEGQDREGLIDEVRCLLSADRTHLSRAVFKF